MIILYDFELSAECYAVRLLLGFTGIAHKIRPVDMFPGREQDEAWFRALSPDGTLPVLDDDGLVLTALPAILAHIAARSGGLGRWWPAAARDEIARWFAHAESLADSALRARWIITTGDGHSLPVLQVRAHALLRTLDRHVWFAEKSGADWLAAGAHPSLADVAVFPAVALCEEGGISRQDYPAIRRWLDRVRRIPGFHVMSGVFPAGPARADVPFGSQ
jgi:glutathione S-transferase